MGTAGADQLRDQQADDLDRLAATIDAQNLLAQDLLGVVNDITVKRLRVLGKYQAKVRKYAEASESFRKAGLELASLLYPTVFEKRQSIKFNLALGLRLAKADPGDNALIEGYESLNERLAGPRKQAIR